MDADGLPFEVGQLVETRSFLRGFRGAWFRCKIKEIGRRRGELGHAVEYIDFPDEKITWIKVYQKYSRSKKQTLMVRPQFPSVYRESQKLDVNTISETVVIVNDLWNVGDLVDWWTDDCFWTGRITVKMDNEKFKIELLPKPEGEGCSYDVSCKDLRPALDWSVDEGWKLAEENKYPRFCARIVKPLNQGSSPNSYQTLNEREKSVQSTAEASIKHEGSSPSPHKRPKLAKNSLNEKETHTTEKVICLETVDHVPKRRNCSGGVSPPHIQDLPTQMPRMVDKYDDIGFKKIKDDGSICLNSTYSDTIEAAILDLEELICRVKWLKRILDYGTPLSDNFTSPWKFVEHRALSIPK